MKQKCVDAVKAAAGRELRTGEAQDITDRINKNFRTLSQTRREEFMRMTPEQRLQESAKMAAEELKADAIKKKQRIALTIKAHDKIDRYAAQQKLLGINKIESLKRKLAAYSDGKSNTQSVESLAYAIRSDNMRQMIDALESIAPKTMGLFSNEEGTKALVHELFGQDSRKITDAETAKLAKIAAEQWIKVSENLRAHFNNSGGEIGKLENWRFPQSHSQNIIAKVGREKWVSDLLPTLDRKKYTKEDGSYMSDPEMIDFLNKSWENIATGGANKADIGENRLPSMKARRHAEERALHFKDADSFLSYQAKYSEKDTYSTIVSHVDRLSHDIALIQEFGPNPDLMFKNLLNKYIAEEAKETPQKAKAIVKRSVSAENLYDYIAGKTLPVANETIARGFDTLRQWMVATRLGSAVITSLSDEATMHLSASINNMSHMQMMRNQWDTLNMSNRSETKTAQRAGLALNTFISEVNRFGADALGANFSNKMANLTLRLSGLSAITEARRRAFGVTMYGSIGHTLNKFKTFTEIPEGDKRILKGHGVDETVYQVWKKAELEDWGHGNNTMITPEAIYRIPDNKLAGLGEPIALRRDAALKLIGHVIDETNIAVIEPGAASRAMMQSGIQKGTWKGEIMKSFWLFKGFPIATFTQHLVRGWNMPTGTGKVAYLASFIAATTLLGATSTQISELVTGREVRDMTDKRFWLMALLKGGSMGIYGDFVFNVNTHYGSTPLAVLSGPVSGTIEDLIGLTQGNIVESAQGKTTHAGAEAVKFLKTNTPLQNLWYTKAVTDRLIFNRLQEIASPGYMDKVEARARDLYNQKYWWHLKDQSPKHPPDFSKALGNK